MDTHTIRTRYDSLDWIDKGGAAFLLVSALLILVHPGGVEMADGFFGLFGVDFGAAEQPIAAVLCVFTAIFVVGTGLARPE